MTRSPKGLDAHTLEEARELLASTSSPGQGYAAVLNLARRSRGALRAVAVVAEEDEGLMEWLRGREVSGDSPRAMVRHALQREEGARTRRNPIHRDEGFRCQRCAAEVPAAGGSPRNHCSRCLWSLHVDEVPGDRKNRCAGAMAPISWERSGGRVSILHRCQRCGLERRARFREDTCPPDDLSALLAIKVEDA